MGGSVLQLVAKGVETLYLTENPQITQFKVVYRRHTNFTLFDRDLHFKGKLSYGDKATYKVRNIGDIMYGLALIVELSDVSLTFEPPSVLNIKNVLSSYSIKWVPSTSATMVTQEIYESEILPLVDNKLNELIELYSDSNDLLGIFDSKFSVGPDVYSGEYYLVDKEYLYHSHIAIETDILGFSTQSSNISDVNDLYVYLDVTKFDVTGSTVTITPDTDLYDSNTNAGLFYATEDWLIKEQSRGRTKNFNTYNISEKTTYRYIAIKKSAITEDYSVSQTITLTNNVYVHPNEGHKLIFRSYNESMLIRGNINYEDVRLDSNNNIELFTWRRWENEFNDVHMFYNIDGLDISGGTLTVDLASSNILKNNGDVIYCSKNYINDYFSENGSSGTYIAINRNPFLSTSDTSIVIDLTEHGYIASGESTYTLFTDSVITETEKMYCLLKQSGVTDTGSSIFFSYISLLHSNFPNGSIAPTWPERDVLMVSNTTLNKDNNLIISVGKIKKYFAPTIDYGWRVNLEDVEKSPFGSTDKWVLLKTSDVTLLPDTLQFTFQKSNVLRGDNAIEYYTATDTDPKSTDVILDSTITSTLVNGTMDVFAVDRLSNVEYDIKDSNGDLISVKNPYVFMVKALESQFELNDSYKINQALYTGLLALFSDVASNPDRNIAFDDMNSVRVSMYIQFISAILDVQKAYGNFVLSYPDDSIEDGSTVSWIDPTTGAQSNKTIKISKSKQNITFLHVLDMSNYSNIPIKSNVISKSYDYVLNNSYTDTSSYTFLDGYVIYQNFINEMKTSGIDFLPSSGFYDSVTLINTAQRLTTSIGNNYKSNSEMFYQLLEMLENVKIISDNQIHMAIVYQNTSINIDGSTRITYGSLTHNNDERHIVNIVDSLIRVASEDTTVTIYFKNEAEKLFNGFLDSVRAISSTTTDRAYFDKLLYWNECMLESQVSYISDTSMKRTLEISNDASTYNIYSNIFGTKRVILSHLPYCLVQNIPYAIHRIIMTGGLFDIASEVFAFPDVVSTEDRTRIKNVLFDYLGLQLAHSGFVETYKNGDNSTVNKKTVIEDLEETMFTMTIGSSRSDGATYYNNEYFVSLKSSGDLAQTKYIIVPFVIEAIAELDEDSNLGFPAETNLTPTDYVVKKFKRIYKEILYDFMMNIKNGHFTDENGATQTIETLTNNALTSSGLDFSFVESMYTHICDVLNTYARDDVIEESIYSNTYSTYTDSQIFTEIRTTSVSDSHNYKLLDVQSSIWNTIQKKNIRAYNELFYNGLLSMTTLNKIGGTNILGFHDDLINILKNNSEAPEIYHDEYTDTYGVTHAANLNENATDLTPVGVVGVDYYRLRQTSIYDVLKEKLSADISYFSFLLNTRYHPLKAILHIKSFSLFQRTYTYNSVEQIIKQLAVGLISQYDIASGEEADEMISIIGYKDGQSVNDFKNVAKYLYDSKLSIFDIIKSGGGYRDGSDNGIANSGDNIYNKILKVNGNPVTNPFDEVTDENMYKWYDDYKSIVSMTDVFTYFSTLLNKIFPHTLFLHSNKDSFFKGYERYTEAILFMLNSILDDTFPSTNSFHKRLSSTFTTEVDIFNNITDLIVSDINTIGKSIFSLSTFNDGSTNYEEETTGELNGKTIQYRYKVFTLDDIKTDGSELDTRIKKLLSNDKPNFKYVKELGHRLIESVSVNFGGQEIDRHTDEILSHIANISTPPEQYKGYMINIGDTEEMQAYNSDQKSIRKLYIPLRFWFCNNVGNGLPLINLLHTDILIDVKIRNVDDLIIRDEGSFYIRPPKLNCRLMGNFIYLDDEERLTISKSKLEFLMTKYQYNGDHIFTSDDIYSDNKVRLPLNFSDPAKYIYWKMEYKETGVKEDKFDWRLRELKDNLTQFHVRSMDECKIKFNGRVRETYKDYNYYNLYHPYTKGIYNLFPGEFIYSFALNPLDYQPSGSASLTNVEDFTMIAKLHDKAVVALNNGYVLSWKVWAQTINIVVVISGIGGLRFFGT